MFSKFKYYSNWGQGDFRVPTSKSSAPNWNQMILRRNKSNQDLSFLPVLVSHRTLRHKTPINGIKDAFPRFVVNTEAPVRLSACLSVWEPKKKWRSGTAVTGCCKSIKTFTDTDTTSGSHTSQSISESITGRTCPHIDSQAQNHVGEKGACV